ncbi:MAG TPA: NlpC/P60 family protein [Marmoricola sp.]|nr:NlpC/P60 family protein [Marmoricola sp.]
MRTRTRGVLTAILTVAVLLPVSAPAQADKPKPGPTQAQVDQAKAVATRKAGDVAALQGSLAAANARLQEAGVRAEIAAEAYNGAMWRLQQAQQATATAKAAAADALAHVAEQRAGIAQLVTQSYQDGTVLNGMSAFLGAEGPTGVMSRLGVVQSAGDSMQARFDQYTALNALARVAETKAAQAEKVQAGLAEKAATLRDQAAQAAAAAQNEAVRIASERRQLLQDLAKAQKVSLDLATERQKALERKAEQAAAAAAAAKAKAEAAQAKAQAKAQAAKAKDATDKAKADAQDTQDQLAEFGVEGGWSDPGLPIPKGTGPGATAAIEFAKAQLGEPYVWGGAGPDVWDCSGLTMMAWAAGGISLPHFAAAQYQLTKHISPADLKAGDLVFWGTSPNTIHHVALYIGNGQIIQAPHTGDVVKVSPLFASPPDFFGRP